jgi:hypothetical protein
MNFSEFEIASFNRLDKKGKKTILETLKTKIMPFQI